MGKHDVRGADRNDDAEFAEQTPDGFLEVDDVDQTYQRAVAAKCEILYGITDEPWGVRRFYLRDPFGKVLNVLSHAK